jgi:hypothetical protein
MSRQISRQSLPASVLAILMVASISSVGAQLALRRVVSVGDGNIVDDDGRRQVLELEE